MSTNNTELGGRLVELIIEEGLANTDEIEGCTESEIRQVEEKFDIEFPKTYRSYLEYLGKSSGGYLRGHICHYPLIKEVREDAVQTLKQSDTPFELSDDDFVFLSSQSVAFFYFDVTNPDPEVYLFTEINPSPEKSAESFSEWAINAVDGIE